MFRFTRELQAASAECKLPWGGLWGIRAGFIVNQLVCVRLGWQRDLFSPSSVPYHVFNLAKAVTLWFEKL